MGKPVFLVGYMGSGKTTTGKKLARNIGYYFFDLDDEIEKMTEKSIAGIFREEGEDAFRILEHSVLTSLSNRKNIVVATGGGTPCFYNNMEIMKKSGLTVYLKMKPESLAKRLLTARVKRPLVEGIEPGDLADFIRGHMGRREDFYNLAQLTIKGESLDMDQLVQSVKEYL